MKTNKIKTDDNCLRHRGKRMGKITDILPKPLESWKKSNNEHKIKYYNTQGIDKLFFA